MTNEDLDLMIDALAINLLANEISFEDTGISSERIEKFVNKLKSNEYIVSYSNTTPKMANEVLNRILERNEI